MGRFARALLGLTALPLGLYMNLTQAEPVGRQLSEARGLPHPLAIGHRGAAAYAPELTLASFALARDLGAHYLETDVQRTADGVLINFHDETPARTTNVASVYPDRIEAPIGSFTSAELSRLDAGSWFNTSHPELARPGFVGLQIPTLEAYVETAAASNLHHPGVLIEFKSPELYPGIEEAVLLLLRDKGWLDERFEPVISPAIEGHPLEVGLSRNRVIVQSFSAACLEKLRNLAPSVPRILLVDEDDEAKAGGFQALVTQASSLSADLGAVGYLASFKNVRAAHDAGRLFIVWTLNKPLHFRIARLFRVDGVISDRSDLYLHFVGEKTSKVDTLLSPFGSPCGA